MVPYVVPPLMLIFQGEGSRLPSIQFGSATHDTFNNDSNITDLEAELARIWSVDLPVTVVE